MPNAFLSSLLRLPDKWHTYTTVRSQIDAISRDFVFQILVNEYIKVSGGISEGQYDAMLVRVFQLTAEVEKQGMPVLPQKVLKVGGADDATKEEAEDEEDIDDDEKSKSVAKRWEMSMTFRSHCLGLFLAPKKAQPLYYDRSGIIIGEALDKDDQVTDIFVAMLIGFSAIPPNSELTRSPLASFETSNTKAFLREQLPEAKSLENDGITKRELGLETRTTFAAVETEGKVISGVVNAPENQSRRCGILVNNRGFEGGSGQTTTMVTVELVDAAPGSLSVEIQTVSGTGGGATAGEEAVGG
ncbi:uncharacterized protein EV420DRAFT_1481208 [Desarmillaria tabescens]|uniref:Uncharacterized protein n=1 Tax=Armillaria tabescens TaxID=1929756 RepID=A0AA39K9L2_ARMTA|nr:uncharacterized protein EV420DRAFT_1481208 [Desarmillaria tabescens]KAK0455769.1 hypothetical protein EV420DRAFT_1481208 [Desarmillaria tabescens]